MSSRFPLYIIGIVLFASFFSCTDMVPTKEVRLIDSLNGKAYAYRYRSLDSSYKYANEAYRQVNFYKSGKAEASNNLGFCAFMAMDFDRAEALHKEVYKLTKNELELLIADIVDTAGTITKAANIMLDAGAKSVRAIASHCVMSDPASFRVQESALTEMVFTDSIPYAKKCPKVKQLSIADMFAETIKRVMNNESISSQYII